VSQLSYADFLNSDLGRFVHERLKGDMSDVVHDLLAHLAATDHLIDLIVYRLYGLTEEEIAIVEHTSERAG